MDYRGEVGIILVNHGDKRFKVRMGDRIAQLVFAKVPKQPRFKNWSAKNDTERGSGGYGSTGKN
jgi:dUTP pyrophosphatase